MMLVHGTPTWSFEWRHVIRAFSATHRCIAPDLVEIADAGHWPHEEAPDEVVAAIRSTTG